MATVGLPRTVAMDFTMAGAVQAAKTSASSNRRSLSWMTASNSLSTSLFPSTFRPTNVKTPRGNDCNSSKVVTAVLDKSSGKSSSSSSSDSEKKRLDPAREAFERLFAQAQRYDDRTRSGLLAVEEDLEEAVVQLEGDLLEALAAMRAKEKELSETETDLKKEKLELQTARAHLVKREKEIENAKSLQEQRGNELKSMKAQMQGKEAELVLIKKTLKEREVELQDVKTRMIAAEAQLLSANTELEKKERLVKNMESELEAKESQLTLIVAEVCKQKQKLMTLQDSVTAYEEGYKKLRSELDQKKTLLQKTEIDLEDRAVAFLAAQDEMQVLRRHLRKASANDTRASEELKNAQLLLRKVELELGESQNVVNQFRLEVQNQQAMLEAKESELVGLQAILLSQEKLLLQATMEATRERESLLQMRSVCASLELQVAEQKDIADGLKIDLEAERAKMEASLANVADVKKELRQKDADLSDVQLALKLREAELFSTRLEIQQMKSDYASREIVLRDQTYELEAAERSMDMLQKELIGLRADLTAREGQLVQLRNKLFAKDQELVVMKEGLTESRIKLAEAEGIVEQIADLSKLLADSAVTGSSGSVTENLVLMQTSYELFAANRALLDKELDLQMLHEKEAEDVLTRQALVAELDSVKECLREKEVELEIVKLNVVRKEEEMKKLMGTWEAREAELEKMKEGLASGAREIEMLWQAAKAKGISQPSMSEDGTDATVTKLELEVAKLDAQNALAALQGLVNLSVELKEECLELPDSSSAFENTPIVAATFTGAVPDFNSPVGESKEKNDLARLHFLEQKVQEKDTALIMAKKAMENLATLTRRLVEEAGDAELSVTSIA